MRAGDGLAARGFSRRGQESGEDLVQSDQRMIERGGKKAGVLDGGQEGVLLQVEADELEGSQGGASGETMVDDVVDEEGDGHVSGDGMGGAG